MQIDRRYKIEKAVSNDKTRQQLTEVMFNAEKNELYATNGKILAVVPVKAENQDKTGFIPPEAFEIARKQNTGGMLVNGAIQVGSVTLQRHTEEQLGRFPNVDMVLNTHKGKIPVVEFTVSAKLLKELADALGEEKYHGITLTVYGPLDSIRVTTTNGAYGEIMPMRGDKK